MRLELTEPEKQANAKSVEKKAEYPELYGVVSIADIEAADTCIGSKRAIAEYLIWEKGIGQVLCMDCIQKKMRYHTSIPFFRNEKGGLFMRPSFN